MEKEKVDNEQLQQKGKKDKVNFKVQKNTYFKTEGYTDSEGVKNLLELDLKTYRQKGAEDRYLSIIISVMGPKEGDEKLDIPYEISSEEEFNEFKKFICTLNWND